MPDVHLNEETLDRLDSLRVDDESYDELINELLNIYQTTEMTLYTTDEEP